MSYLQNIELPKLIQNWKIFAAALYVSAKKAYLLNNKKWQPCIEISARVFILAIQNFGMGCIFRDG